MEKERSSGFFNIYKPKGMTSHDVVAKVRRILHIKKVGHAGTLDPAATGVLPIAVGKATRLIEYLANTSKTYRTEILFGKMTDTGDLDGKILEEHNISSMPSTDEILSVLSKFRGHIIQRPPVFSAIKIHGKRAYELSRAGIEVEIPERTIQIHRIELLHINEQSIEIEVDCSKGTYIRSLGMDIGRALGLPSVLKSLERTRVGAFPIETASSFELLEEKQNHALLIPDACLPEIPKCELYDYRVSAFCNGLSTRMVLDPSQDLQCYRVYNHNIFLGIGRYNKETGELVPEKVFLTPNEFKTYQNE